MKLTDFLVLLLPLVLAQVPEEEPLREIRQGAAPVRDPVADPVGEDPVVERPIPIDVPPPPDMLLMMGDDDDDDGGKRGQGDDDDDDGCGKKGGDDDDDDDDDCGGKKSFKRKDRNSAKGAKRLGGRDGTVYGGTSHRNNRLGGRQLTEAQREALRNRRMLALS